MSIFFVNTQNAQISNAFIATLGAAPGSTYLAEIKAAGLIPSVQAMITATGSSTAAALSTKVATNLGLTGTAFTGGTAYLGSVTFAGASSTWAANLMSTLDLFTTLQFDAIYGSAATAYLARVNSAVSYSVVATNNSTDLSTLAAAVGSAGSTGSGSTFTLTTDANTFVGGSGNDTFRGSMDDDTAGNNTFTILDSITGGDGIDTLSISVDTSAAAIAFPAANVVGIEVLEFRNVSGRTLTVDAGLFAGETTLTSDRSTAAVTFTGVAAGTTIVSSGTGAGVVTATHGAAVTSGTLNVASGSTAASIAMDGAAFTSLTVNSTGSSNVLGGAITTNSALVQTVTINAAAALLATSLTLGGNVSAQALVISGAAADLAATTTAAARSAVSLGALDTDFDSVNAAGLTAGGVAVTLSATVAATFTGGAGSDRVTTSTTGQTGAVNAGAGIDTLILANSVDIDIAAEGAIYTGFEILQAQNGVAIDMDLVTGSTITSILINDAAGTTAVTDMTATQAAAVTILAGAGAMTLGIKDATQVGTQNTLNITVSDGNTTGSQAVLGTGNLTIAGVETINITATDDVTLASMANITGLTSLTVTGAADVSITTLVHVVTTNESINFSGLTAASTFNFAGATTNALAFTGGSGIDTVTTSVIGGNVISTGAGRDVITLTQTTGGTAGNIITAGAGGDSIVATSEGNAAFEVITFKYLAGDSVSDSATATTGFVAAKMDAITAVDLAIAAAAGAGHVMTFDTIESATAVTFGGTTGVTFGTTAVTNAFDFYVFNTAVAGVSALYQDTNGNKVIDSGEWAVQITGVTTTLTTANEFAVTGGNLVLTTVVG